MTTIPSPSLSPDAVTAWGSWLSSVAPIIAPAVGAFAGWWLGRKERVAKIEEMETKHRKDADTDTAAVIAAVTQRFQSLIDGYEARVKDLQDEVHSLRQEIRDLRIALDGRPRPEIPNQQA